MNCVNKTAAQEMKDKLLYVQAKRANQKVLHAKHIKSYNDFKALDAKGAKNFFDKILVTGDKNLDAPLETSISRKNNELRAQRPDTLNSRVSGNAKTGFISADKVTIQTIKEAEPYLKDIADAMNEFSYAKVTTDDLVLKAIIPDDRTLTTKGMNGKVYTKQEVKDGLPMEDLKVATKNGITDDHLDVEMGQIDQRLSQLQEQAAEEFKMNEMFGTSSLSGDHGAVQKLIKEIGLTDEILNPDTLKIITREIFQDEGSNPNYSSFMKSSRNFFSMNVLGQVPVSSLGDSVMGFAHTAAKGGFKDYFGALATGLSKNETQILQDFGLWSSDVGAMAASKGVIQEGDVAAGKFGTWTRNASGAMIRSTGLGKYDRHMKKAAAWSQLKSLEREIAKAIDTGKVAKGGFLEKYGNDVIPELKYDINMMSKEMKDRFLDSVLFNRQQMALEPGARTQRFTKGRSGSIGGEAQNTASQFMDYPIDAMQAIASVARSNTAQQNIVYFGVLGVGGLIGGSVVIDAKDALKGKTPHPAGVFGLLSGSNPNQKQMVDYWKRTFMYVPWAGVAPDVMSSMAGGPKYGSGFGAIDFIFKPVSAVVKNANKAIQNKETHLKYDIVTSFSSFVPTSYLNIITHKGKDALLKQADPKKYYKRQRRYKRELAKQGQKEIF